jgi:hypothetical protein
MASNKQNLPIMKILFRILLLTVAGSIFHNPALAQNQYTDYKTTLQKIDALVKSYSSLCSAKSLTKSAGGKDIMVLTIGTGDKDNKPGIAVIGGVEGNYILGKELALGFAASLLKEASSDEIKKLLSQVTFYVFPDVSPDATEQFFSKLKYERITNARPVDDDRDFTLDEDPYEDLNNDGYITIIRVSDPSGTYIESEDDKRILVPADLSKGQQGAYFIYSEGIDNDKDGNYNEDGPGGVCFNRNLTFNYEEFGTYAGLYPVSEPETRAVLDFLFDHFNIYLTFAFGPQDNLGQPQKSSERTPPSTGQGEMRRQNKKITSIQKSDEIINKLVSDKYHEITGIKGAPPARQDPGNFMDWSYFHYGRYSFSTPGWWFPTEKDKNPEITFLKYAAENKMDDVFVPWTEVKDPDFQGKNTEIGGIKPFVMINPPVEKIDELVQANYKFITLVAAMHPELEFLDLKTENIGDDVFRLTLKVHNKGIFATCTEAGDRNMWTRIMRMTLEPSKSQKLISGQKVQRIPRLEGDKSQEFSWLLTGKGSVKITAGALNTGFITTTAELK